MRVIDSSSLAKYLNREEDWEAVAGALLGECVSLELAVKETGNSLWKRVKRGEVDSKLAQRVFDEFVSSLPVVIAPQAGLYGPAFRMAGSLGLPYYDALFLALAKAKGVPLVTSDRVQAEGARKLGIEVQLVA